MFTSIIDKFRDALTLMLDPRLPFNSLIKAEKGHVWAHFRCQVQHRPRRILEERERTVEMASSHCPLCPWLARGCKRSALSVHDLQNNLERPEIILTINPGEECGVNMNICSNGIPRI